MTNLEIMTKTSGPVVNSAVAFLNITVSLEKKQRLGLGSQNALGNQKHKNNGGR